MLSVLLAMEGCHIFGATDEEPEYLWHKMDGIANQEIHELGLRDDETLVVQTDEGMYRTNSLDHPLQRVNFQHSLAISGIRKIIVRDTLFYLSTLLPNQLWSSADGIKWDFLFAKKDPMFNIWVTPQGDRIVGTWHGVYRQPRGASNVELIKFLYTDYIDGLDQITTFTQTSSGALFCGSHDGVYRSMDGGSSWKKVSYNIHKDHDDVVELYTDPNNHIYVQTYGGLYRSDDDGNNWEQISSPDDIISPVQFPGNRTVVGITSGSVWKASLNDGKFRKVGPGLSSDYQKIEAIANGKIVVATDSSVFVGIPNPLFPEGDRDS